MPFMSRQPVLDQNKQITACRILIEERGKGEIKPEFREKMGDFLLQDRVIIPQDQEDLKQALRKVRPRSHIGIEFNRSPVTEKESLLDLCQLMKECGFRLIVNGEIMGRAPEKLGEITDIICIDYSQAEQRELKSQLSDKDLQFMAGNLHTETAFNRARRQGYSYFQGDFYTRPGNSQPRKDIPALKLNYMNLLQKINQPEPDFSEIERIIKNDISLSYNLFRLINSAYFGIKNEVKSIRQALILLGINDFKKWVSLKIMRGLTEDRPGVLMQTSLNRAKFAENLAIPLNLEQKQLDLFMLGLFSLIDSFLNRPLEEVITNLSLSPDIKKALLNYEGKLGLVLELITAFEQGRWNRVDKILNSLKLEPSVISRIYFESVISTNEAIKVLNN
ncbi:MAG: EAL and HDOD domain-containing protein [Bacillota bacterium]